MYLILGMSRTGQATSKWLQKKDFDVMTFDDEVGKGDFFELSAIPWDKVKTIVQSPGVPFTLPKPHPVTQWAKERNIPIITDINLLNASHPKAHYIGITGTNGKSTTTALVGHILKHAGMNVAVGGNIGKAVLELDSLSEDGVYVLELSSYQLEMGPPIKLDVAAWINITPDHLERHGTMERYMNAKARIFLDAKAAVIGIDDPISRTIYERRKKTLLTRSISAFGENADVTIQNATLFEKQKPIGLLQNLNHLMGQHNDQNIAVAYGIGRQIGLASLVILEALKTFQGLEHRLEFVGQIGRVRFMNDSKATNGNATATALRALSGKPIYLILGGVAKSDGLRAIKHLLHDVQKFYVIGSAAESFAQELSNHTFDICSDLQTATQKAFQDAQNHGHESIVLLSPACASFDQFQDFEERGRTFKRIVQELL